MKAIVISAGYATRLYPLTLDKPKALLPIKGKPIIEYVLEKVDKVKKIDKIFLISNNKFYTNFSWWLSNNQKNFKKTIEIVDTGSVSVEDQLGMLNDSLIAIEQFNLNEDLLILYSDNLFSIDLDEIINFFEEKKSSGLACYKLKNKQDARKFGIIEIDQKNRIIGTEEKPQEPKSDLAVTGIYFIKKEDIKKLKEFFKESEKKGKLNPGFGLTHFIQDLYKNQDVYAFPFSGDWIDIGSLEDYEKVK